MVGKTEFCPEFRRFSGQFMSEGDAKERVEAHKGCEGPHRGGKVGSLVVSKKICYFVLDYVECILKLK